MDTFNLSSCQNIAPILDIKEVQKDNKDMTKGGAIIVRQYFSYSLKERIQSMPYLKPIEKMWIAYQMINSVYQLHSKGTCHGDIKMENFTLSSTLSLFLTDVAPFKPAYFPQDELGLISYYFGEIINDKTVCIAPERLIKKRDENLLYEKITTSMDIFSLGCVLAELFSDKIIFDLQTLLHYKDHKISFDKILPLNYLFNDGIIEEALNKNSQEIISDKDSKLREIDLQENSGYSKEYYKCMKSLYNIITKMLSIEPNDRPNIKDIFNEFTLEVAPISFSSMLFQFNHLIVNNNYWNPDMLIGLIYKHWNQIWKVILGPQNINNIINNENKNFLYLYQPLNSKIVNELILDKAFDRVFDLKSLLFTSNLKVLYNEELLINSSEDKKEFKLTLYDDLILTINNNTFSQKENNETILILLDWILPALFSAKYPSTKIVGLEMLLKFSERVTDLDKIQLILPYFTELLEDNNSLVKKICLDSIITLLDSISDKLILPPSDFNFFDSYTFPAIEELIVSGNKESMILAVTNILDKLCDLQNKFLQMTLKSKFFWLSLQHYSLNNNDNQHHYNRITMSTINAGAMQNNNLNTPFETFPINSQNNTNNNICNNDIFKSNPSTRSSMQNFPLSNQQNNYAVNPTQNPMNPYNLPLGEEFIESYDNSCLEFKNKLFKIIEDILSEYSTDIQVSLIRKFPYLLMYLGRTEANNFSKYIITQFNRKNWEIQSEILKVIPEMVVVIGTTNLNEILIPCMEVIVYDLNEIKLLAMVKCLKELYLLGFITNRKLIELYKMLIPMLLHPNYVIRKEISSLTELLLIKTPAVEIYTYLNKSLAPLLKTKFPIINVDVFNKFIKPPLSRIIYELQKQFIDISVLDLTGSDIDAVKIISDFINNSSRGFQNDGFNNNLNNINVIDDLFIKLKHSVRQYNLSDIIKKEFYSFIQKYPPDDMIFIEKTFLGKLISASKILQNLSFPKRLVLLGEEYDSELKDFINTKLFHTESKNTLKTYFDNNNKANSNNSNDHETNFNQINNEIVSMEYFKMKYYFKALDIILNDSILEYDMLTLTLREQQIRQTMLRENYKNYSFNSYVWKPTGQLVTSVYDNEKGGVDKIIPLNTAINNNNSGNNLNFTNSSSKFLSFSSYSGINLYDIIPLTVDQDITVEKVAHFKDYNQDNKSSLEYKISGLIDSNTFVAANESGKIDLFKIEATKTNFKILNSWSSDKESSRVSALLEGNKLLNDREIIYTTTRGEVNIIDTRGPSKASSSFIGSYRGIVSSIEQMGHSILLGTYAGYLMEYDLRLNCVTRTLRYSENTPITSVKKFSPSFSQINITESFFKKLNPNGKYLLINTAGNDHEIGFWNMNSMNCDLLLKVNPSQGSFKTPLMTEIPSLYDENVDKVNTIMMNYSLNKMHFKKLNIYSVTRDLYSQSNQRILKHENIFQSVSNIAQAVYSPIGYSENANYIITGGNDRVLRFWDLSNEGLSKSSYIINCPNSLEVCSFSQCMYGTTYILQSNENYNTNLPKKNCSFSDYQHYNGLRFHLAAQNEFDSSDDILKYATKISDASHKGMITDVTSIGIPFGNNIANFLMTSSWDGTIKIWK